MWEEKSNYEKDEGDLKWGMMYVAGELEWR